MLEFMQATFLEPALNEHYLDRTFPADAKLVSNEYIKLHCSSFHQKAVISFSFSFQDFVHHTFQ